MQIFIPAIARLLLQYLTRNALTLLMVSRTSEAYCECAVTYLRFASSCRSYHLPLCLIRLSGSLFIQYIAFNAIGFTDFRPSVGLGAERQLPSSYRSSGFRLPSQLLPTSISIRLGRRYTTATMVLCLDSSILVFGGGGTMGSSTALHLARKGYRNIRVLDVYPIPSAQSAGNDLNKIMGLIMLNPVDKQLTLAAEDMWTNDPTFSPYYHRTGRVSYLSRSLWAHIIDSGIYASSIAAARKKVSRSYGRLSKSSKITTLAILLNGSMTRTPFLNAFPCFHANKSGYASTGYDT